ncbi:DUF6075 family protein [Lachnospiraceae bacterium 45-W7]
MVANTATGAGKREARTITFKNEEYKKFFKSNLQKCRYQDVYHMALVYCLGIDRDTRVNVDRIYDFKSGCVKTECLGEGCVCASAWSTYLCIAMPSITFTFCHAPLLIFMTGV